MCVCVHALSILFKQWPIHTNLGVNYMPLEVPFLAASLVPDFLPSRTVNMALTR